ncbi:adhesion G-protein coupled receptor G2 [Cheilinus undulatus]|uniref:adhesion G-protein coupled receptor G2 n=1 Tax=Cheilinus undulatus TaxID=241271 RepID=UPI001BD5E454|nr:adhesion G-protein coupled receptor G2 [Cheilinus undulatus]
MNTADDNFNCVPSNLSSVPGSLFNIHKCFNKGVHNVRLSNKTLCGKDSPEEECQGFPGTDHKFSVSGDGNNLKVTCASLCKPSQQDLCPERPPESDESAGNSLEAALNIVGNISFILESMTSCSTVAIKKGKIRGLVHKLPAEEQTSINIGITSKNISILKDNNDSQTELSLLVQVSKEASEMAVKRGGSYVGLFQVPEVYQDLPDSSFLNNEAVEIEMGAEISNLSETIDIQFRNVDKKGKVASCRSWNGKGKDPIWIKDGCYTNETNDTVTCQCSHLTFFAVLLSPPPRNISISDLRSLTYITSIGCGLSLFFLVVAIIMHCLIRKRKASQATHILINLFVAMFTLNLSFLTNEKIANLGNFGVCVAIAALLHYTMLATFSWFLVEALHFYFTLLKLPSTIKHYMKKICIMGWATPAIVVIPLLALKKYNYLDISADDGTKATMCWISDASIHQGVNIGYYAVVFIFTLSIFILTVRQFSFLKPPQVKTWEGSSIRSNSFSILGLFLLLGLTWAFAFFSYGPLLIVSYYIFTILNSFQGFFLFIYYCYSSKAIGGNSSATATSSSSTATSNTAIPSLYQ